MKVWTSEPSLWAIVFLLYAGVDGQYTVNIINNPADTPVSGSTNTFDYPILSNVTLTCMVNPTPLPSVTSYQWNTAGCYTNSQFTDGNSECFPHGQTTQNVTGNDLNAEDAGTITCTVMINGSDYTSEPFTLRISGVALINNTDIAHDNILTENFLFASATTNTNTILARCVTGLGPPGNQNNTILGQWTFNESVITYGECTNNHAIQPRGADVAGVIDLYQCGTFMTTAEGIYTCTIMDSSMVNQSMSVGVYFPGRTPPVIDTPSPSTEIVAIGSSLTLSCTSRGSPPDTFTWRKDNGPVLQSTTTPVTYNDNSAVFRADYSIDSVTTSDSGTYTCNVTNPIGSNSTTITVATVSAPTVTHSGTQTVVGQPLTLQCRVTITGSISDDVVIVWSDDDGERLNSTRVTPATMGNPQVYTNSYIIPELSTTDDGRMIQCKVVINATSPVNFTGNITLDVMVPSPNLTILPSGPIQGAMVGSPQVINCTVSTVSGVEPSSVMISWMGPGGGSITSDNRVTISPTTSSGNTYTSSLRFTYLMEGDEGRYICSVMILGTSESESVELMPEVPPPIVSVTALNSQTVGQSLTLQCEVTTVRGITSRVDIVWSNDGTVLRRMNGVSSTTMDNPLVYTHSYVISQLNTTYNDRVIQCEVVINASQSVMTSDSIILDVTFEISKPDLNQSAERPNAGSSHNLTCTFTLPFGVEEDLLRIEWSGHPSLNDEEVITTNLTHVMGLQYAKTVTFEHIQVTDNGSYNCTVSIVGFAVSSDVIVVNVNVIVVSEESDSSNAGAIAGGVVAALFVVAIILLVVVILILWYRRREPAEQSSEEARKRSRKSTSSENSLSSKHGLMGGKNGNAVASSPSEIQMDPIENEVKQRMEPIALEKFSNYVLEMHKDRDFGFETEYATISDQPLFTCDAAKSSSNNFKNRYVNINPYDFSRVKLIGVSGKGKDTDYINASYIDGYQKPNAYIAAQGPLPETVKDFWQMIWDYKLRTIVMLTKPVEAGTAKCEVYWPEKVNETLALKPTLQVRTTYMQYFADFDMRTFELSNPSEPSDMPLEVFHFFFTSWPDHGVPQFATALISFIKKVRKHYTSDGPPMVVHCSAGVGRSGTYITLDTMLQRMSHTKNVNVYEFVHNMRMKRVFMVQTLAQYIFVHDALEELITCGDTSFNAQDMISRTAKLSNEISGKGITGFEEQFDLLQKVSRQFTEGDCSDALTQHNISKNRHNNAVPYNVSRVQMKATPLPGSDYINASFVDGYKHRNAFITTQCPMENTVNDFWRMMWESQSAVIVMLCNEEHDPQDFYKFWPDEEAQYGKIKVTQKSKSERNCYNGYKFTVLGESVKSTSLQVSMLHYTNWAPLKAPGNTKALLGVTKELLEVQRHTGNKAITVMCSDGCGRTGSFITICYTLERVKAEQTVDIFQAIKNSRIRRTGLVSNTEQYEHCHHAIIEFLDEFSAYSNFV